SSPAPVPQLRPDIPLELRPLVIGLRIGSDQRRVDATDWQLALRVWEISMRASKRFLGMVFALALSGCNVLDTMLDRTVDTAAQRTGERVGERVGDAAAGILVQMTPQLMGLYVQGILGYAFYGAWGWNEQESYEVGEWTRWRTVDSEAGQHVVMEKAFLNRTDEGNAWWKVKYRNVDDGQEIVLEGLFSPGREKLLRLRGRFPGQAASEIPVQENIVYARGATLTAESLAAARVGEATVAVPAG